MPLSISEVAQASDLLFLTLHKNASTFRILLFLLETLPRDLIDAAKIDKVKKWQLHYFITFPMLKGSLITIALIKAIESLRSFDLIFTMTKGGPGITTETLDLYAYQQGIGLRGEISYASAMSVAMVIITIVIFTFIWNFICLANPAFFIYCLDLS